MGNSEITLIATGDIMLVGSLLTILKQNRGQDIFSPFRPFFQGADIIFGNLEAPLSKKGRPQKNKILLSQEKEGVETLKDNGYNILSIGNNHMMDYGDIGLEETLSTLAKYELQHVGAGRSVHEARKPARFNIKETNIFFLGYTSQTTELTNPLQYASNTKKGLVPLDLKILEEDITKARSSGADIVIVSLHWGEERCHYPSPQQREQAHAIIELGADIILGHHSHILQGIERYQNGLIIYSLGNFLFSEFQYPNGQIERWAKKHRLTALIDLKISRNKPFEYSITPLWIGEDLVPRLLKGKKNDTALSKIQRYSECLKSPDYKNFWKKAVVKEEINTILEKITHKLFRYEI